jgi:hypothetical protein
MKTIDVRLQSIVPPLAVTLPPINSCDFSLDACGGFIEPFDDIYDDQVFVPRVGGTIALAFDP